ncbi:hypothetical protein [Gluconacetobacter asukensis]|uniref:Uncharacterized protein n=1 Tax=Gluconacetobacter asukensis TaxID=1017181 RepID=A0A7W4J3Y3_9PROT|nr:hypothetical protein [Gluconacetobacter asukensis]MBB2174187.1 hypothetical protein [Gluconacetobacter asukensis]
MTAMNRLAVYVQNGDPSDCLYPSINLRFMALSGHYLFETTFRNPAA